MSTEYFTRRQEKLRTALGEQQVDGMLITNLIHIRYLCGFTGSSGSLLMGPDSCEFVTDGRYVVQSKNEVRGANITIDSIPHLQVIKNKNFLSKDVTIAFDGKNVSHQMFSEISDTLSHVKWKNIVGCIERLAMENIIKKIKENYPKLKDNLLDLVEIDENINDDRFNYYFEKLFYSNNLWPKKRKKHQYLFLSKYAYYHKKKIDIGVLGIHEKSKLAKFLNKNLVKSDDNYIINKKNHPLYYINFPLFGRTKEQLLETAQKNGYDDILKLTWSCWFPDNGKPCKKCPMCKERILEHPNND